MRRLVTEYIKAKLNNELQSWRVTIPISDFFDLPRGDASLRNVPSFWTAEAQWHPADGRERLGYKDSMLTHLQEVLNDGAHTFSYTVTPTELVQRLASEASRRGRPSKPCYGRERLLGTPLRPCCPVSESSSRKATCAIVTPSSSASVRLFRGREPTKNRLWLGNPHSPDVPTGTRRQRFSTNGAVLPSECGDLGAQLVEIAQNCGAHVIDQGRRRNRQPESALYFDNFYPDKYYIQVPGSVREIKEKLRYDVRTEPYIDFDSMNSMKEQGSSQLFEIGRPAGFVSKEGGYGAARWSCLGTSRQTESRSCPIWQESSPSSTVCGRRQMRLALAPLRRYVTSLMGARAGSNGSEDKHTQDRGAGYPVPVWVWTSQGGVPRATHCGSP